jgi:hypothetical protein
LFYLFFLLSLPNSLPLSSFLSFLSPLLLPLPRGRRERMGGWGGRKREGGERERERKRRRRGGEREKGRGKRERGKRE